LAPEPPLDEWFAELDALAARSNGFFVGRPIVLDLSGLAVDKAGIEQLLADLAKRNVRVMAIEGAGISDLGPGLPPIVAGGREASAGGTEQKPQPDSAPNAPAPRQGTLLIDRPVRSGEAVSFPEGDVIVVGSVGSGAEIVAGGSIHVYGALRGRAIAGTVGNGNARIFCRRLEAELLAVDGLYLTADGMNPQLCGRAVQVWLKGQTLAMTALD
jgi:septum site-determining protein MinC